MLEESISLYKNPVDSFYTSPEVLTFGGLEEAIAHDITEDTSGNFYVVGYFSGTSDFDPTEGTDEQTSEGGNDVFLAKYDSNSHYLWTKTFGGTNTDMANAVVTDSTGNIYLTRCFWETADFDPAVGPMNTRVLVGAMHSFQNLIRVGIISGQRVGRNRL